MALKLLQYFYLLIEKPLGRYFHVRSPYYWMAQCNHKTPIPISSRWLLRSEKAKKRISINAKHSVHLPNPVSTDLTIKPDSVSSNPIGNMGCQAGWCKTSTPSDISIMTPSLEGQPTKAKEAKQKKEKG